MFLILKWKYFELQAKQSDPNKMVNSTNTDSGPCPSIIARRKGFCAHKNMRSNFIQQFINDELYSLPLHCTAQYHLLVTNLQILEPKRQSGGEKCSDVLLHTLTIDRLCF